jgi:FKBP-type peptidyl-prolyl cis-trans isomerase
MKATKGLLWLFAGGLILAGCQDTSFKKTKSGLAYKIFQGHDTAAVHPGNFMKLHVVQKINDSVVYDSHGKLPVYLRAEESGRPYDASEVFKSLKLGDSLVTVQMMDSFIKQNPALLGQFKKGDRIVTSFKVLGIYKNINDYREDEAKEGEKFMAAEKKEIADYIAKNNINAQPAEGGVYVSVIEPGQGPQADSGKYVSVMYKGTTFSGKTFDTNMDTSFHHTDPLRYTVASGQMIRGLDNGIKLLKNGSHAKIYIPSMLAYGPNPPSPDIKPFENLVFEVRVMDVQDKAPAPKNMVPSIKVDTAQARK